MSSLLSLPITVTAKVILILALELFAVNVIIFLKRRSRYRVEGLSKNFGTEKRPYKSVQYGDTGQSVSISYQVEEIMPRAKIEALSQGTFCGYVADTFKQKIKHKTFCGEIVFDHKPTHNETIHRSPTSKADGRNTSRHRSHPLSEPA